MNKRRQKPREVRVTCNGVPNITAWEYVNDGKFKISVPFYEQLRICDVNRILYNTSTNIEESGEEKLMKTNLSITSRNGYPLAEIERHSGYGFINKTVSPSEEEINPYSDAETKSLSRAFKAAGIGMVVTDKVYVSVAPEKVIKTPEDAKKALLEIVGDKPEEVQEEVENVVEVDESALDETPPPAKEDLIDENENQINDTSTDPEPEEPLISKHDIEEANGTEGLKKLVEKAGIDMDAVLEHYNQKKQTQSFLRKVLMSCVDKKGYFEVKEEVEEKTIDELRGDMKMPPEMEQKVEKLAKKEISNFQKKAEAFANEKVEDAPTEYYMDQFIHVKKHDVLIPSLAVIKLAAKPNIKTRDDFEFAETDIPDDISYNMRLCLTEMTYGLYVILSNKGVSELSVAEKILEMSLNEYIKEEQPNSLEPFLDFAPDELVVKLFESI